WEPGMARPTRFFPLPAPGSSLKTRRERPLGTPNETDERSLAATTPPQSALAEPPSGLPLPPSGPPTGPASAPLPASPTVPPSGGVPELPPSGAGPELPLPPGPFPEPQPATTPTRPATRSRPARMKPLNPSRSNWDPGPYATTTDQTSASPAGQEAGARSQAAEGRYQRR